MLSAIVVLSLCISAASGFSAPQLQVRSDPITVSIHLHSRSSPDTAIQANANVTQLNATGAARAGITSLAGTSDRQ
jgi:hypothetical protein